MSRSDDMRRVARRAPRLPLPAHALVVPVLAGAAGAAFLAWKPGVARSMLGSPRALGFSLLVGAIVLGLGWLLPRLGRGALATAGAQLVPVLVAFGVTVLPAFRDVTVEEAFPATTSTASTSSSAGSAAPSATAERAADADVLGRASLHGIDHSATGSALLVRLSDGARVVRLEALDVEPGPDYQVHLVPGADRTGPGGGVHLGRLRGNKGNQNYDVPENAVTDRPVTVLVWCRAFAVPVAAATIR